VAVIGPDEAAALAIELARAPERGASLVEVISLADARITEDGSRPLIALVEQAGASMLVLDRAGQADETVVEQAAELHESGAVRVRTLALFYDEWLGKLPVSELERISLMFDISELHEARYGRVKRLVDVCGAAVGTVVLAAALPFVLIGNLLANRGPLFYRQPRCGKNGVEFQIVKLRTMRPGDDSSWTEEADERVTPFGAWLRRAHLDELPQVWNVLRGDLSCIGPRPEQPHYVAELSAKIPFYQLRHLVRPGLTGWAQVSYSYGSSEFDALEKLQYEFYYLRHQGLALDARIIGRTLRSVMRLGGR
jgi:lipopolysaccharide/colanic/teichoic acid biosynthesis glycosyltransferase